MADPVIADHWRAQVVFQHVSGFAEDRFVNSWVFRNDTIDVTDSPSELLGAMHRVLDAFYFGAPASTPIVFGYMSKHIADVEYRFYDLGQTPPREPHVRPRLTDPLPTRLQDPLPEEVALCLSYQSDRHGPRGKGRVYLGPFGVGALNEVAPRPVPHPNLIASIVDRATNMMQTQENVTWVQLSQVEQATNVVTGGHVDNAWDTQRRRGTQATARTQFGSALPPT